MTTTRRPLRYTDPQTYAIGTVTTTMRSEVAQLPTAEARLEALATIRSAVELAIMDEVSEARKAGASWRDIGDGLNISKQAAQQRYGG